MNKLLEKKRVWQVDEDFSDSDHYLKDYAMYAQYFKNKEECEYFLMLPLDREGRKKLLLKLAEERQKQIALERCEGDRFADAEHRKLCIPCCLLYKPLGAVPFF